ncbi:hypothetical protein K2Z84_34360 [Candidatus Binatia bacterium]|nr:hypothetical protein [Microbacteriaceae bacterium]MBY0280446.1 hypothetical protein [Candidatus Binatia bacterium]
MATKKAQPDRGFRSPPWRVSSDVVERVAALAEQLPMTASEVARQALLIGLDEIEKMVATTGSGLKVAVGLGKNRQRSPRGRS